MLDYFGKKNPMSRVTRFSEKSFFKKKKSEIWAKRMGSDAIALNFSNELTRLHWMSHASFGETRFLKWCDVINSNSWFLIILKGFSFRAFKLIFCWRSLHFTEMYSFYSAPQIVSYQTKSQNNFTEEGCFFFVSLCHSV